MALSGVLLEFETRSARQARMAASRHWNYLDQFRILCERYRAGESELTVLCAQAGTTLERYSAETLEALRSESRDSGKGPTWLLNEYHAAITTLAGALRDELCDPSERHALAQTLQERLLRAELRLQPPRQGTSLKNA